MKRLLACCLALLLLLLAGCANTSQEPSAAQSGQAAVQADAQQSDEAAVDSDLPQPTETGAETVTELPYLLDTNEYALYTNIFYNDMADDYLGDTQEKYGTLAIIRDSFNGRLRYYVWGYLDETHCCDWQWEFVPKSPETLPEVGSLIEVTGEFSSSSEALDGYWLIDAEVSVEKNYSGPQQDYRLTTMSGTLERVQIINMQYYPDDYEGSSVRFYGRVLDDSTIQDPYYDGSWQRTVNYAGEMPPMGTVVVVTGSFQNGELVVSEVTQSSSY